MGRNVKIPNNPIEIGDAVIIKATWPEAKCCPGWIGVVVEQGEHDYLIDFFDHFGNYQSADSVPKSNLSLIDLSSSPQKTAFEKYSAKAFALPDGVAEQISKKFKMSVDRARKICYSVSRLLKDERRN
jgi:hypothetical protein